MTTEDDRSDERITAVWLPDLLAQVSNRATHTVDHDVEAGLQRLTARMYRRHGSRPRLREHPTQQSFWYSLDAAEQEALSAVAVERLYGSGTPLCRQDDKPIEVIVIKSGWSKVTVEANDEGHIIAIRGPGDTIGERAALRSAPHSATGGDVGNGPHPSDSG